MERSNSACFCAHASFVINPSSKAVRLMIRTANVPPPSPTGIPLLVYENDRVTQESVLEFLTNHTFTVDGYISRVSPMAIGAYIAAFAALEGINGSFKDACHLYVEHVTLLDGIMSHRKIHRPQSSARYRNGCCSQYHQRSSGKMIMDKRGGKGRCKSCYEIERGHFIASWPLLGTLPDRLKRSNIGECILKSLNIPGLYTLMMLMFAYPNESYVRIKYLAQYPLEDEYVYLLKQNHTIISRINVLRVFQPDSIKFAQAVFRWREKHERCADIEKHLNARGYCIVTPDFPKTRGYAVTVDKERYVYSNTYKRFLHQMATPLGLTLHMTPPGIHHIDPPPNVSQWYGPAHLMPYEALLKCMVRGAHIYGNVTHALAGVQPDAVLSTRGAAFAELWAYGNVTLARLGPEHICKTNDPESIIICNNETGWPDYKHPHENVRLAILNTA